MPRNDLNDPGGSILIRVFCFCGFILIGISANYTDTAHVRYITEGPLGRAIVIVGQSLDAASSTVQLQNSTTCKCRYACFAYPHCLGFSLNDKDDGTKECYLTDRKPWDVQYTDDETAFTLFKVDSMGLKHVFPFNDSIYFVPEEMKKYDGIINTCNVIPGFRFAIAKTEKEAKDLYHMTETMANDVYVDLYMTDGNFFWGDDTNFVEADLSDSGLKIRDRASYPFRRPYFIHYDTYAFEWYDTEKYFLCQASIIH